MRLDTRYRFISVVVLTVMALPAWALAAMIAADDPESADAFSARDGVPNLAPVWPASFPAHDSGGYGIIRPIDAPRGFVAGLSRSPDVLAELRELLAPHLEEGVSVVFEGDNAFGYRAIPPGTRPRRPPTGFPSLTFQYVSGEPSENPHPRLTVQRTWFAVFDPAEGVKPRGTALVMPGIFGTPEPTFAAFSAALQKDGWTVLRMMAQPSRFTERARWTIPLDQPEKLAPVMDEIAGTVTRRTAECAYAARAAMSYLLEERPHLAELPRIALGGSGGAMTLPTVVALEPEKYAALVMIAGGADFFTMNIESNYQQMIGAVQLEWVPQPELGMPTAAQLKMLSREYLSRSPLDSYHTALALRGKPMLMIHGENDLAVPAHLGDLLWERLGKPERWSDGSGHEEVFMNLPKQFDDILAWLREHTGPAAAPADQP